MYSVFLGEKYYLPYRKGCYRCFDERRIEWPRIKQWNTVWTPTAIRSNSHISFYHRVIFVRAVLIIVSQFCFLIVTWLYFLIIIM